MPGNRERLIEITEELRKLSQKRRELIEERRELSGTPARSGIAHAWLEPIFLIIEDNPGISRREIFVKFNNPHMKFGDLTNVLTTLRRRGWIENRGTRKQPEWYSRGRIPQERWNTKESIAS